MLYGLCKHSINFYGRFVPEKREKLRTRQVETRREVFMQLIVRFFSVVCGLLLLVSIAGAEGQWELIMSQDGIDTYRMTHPGTSICTFKGVGFVDSNIVIVGEVLRDILAYPEWFYSFKRAKILKKIDRNTYILHAVINTPFPFKNRDAVIEDNALYDFSKGTAMITFRLTKNYNFPQQECCQRLPELDGHFYLEYFGKNKTKVTYQHRFDPGGVVPVNLANAFNGKYYPAVSIAGIREMVKKEKYIKGGLASPEYTSIERMLDNKTIVTNLIKNRIGDIILDPVLLDMVFGMTVPKKIMTNIHTTRADFEVVRQGIVDLFTSVVAKAITGQQKQEVDAIAAYLADKKFDTFFSMNRFMEERWLVDGIIKDNKMVPGLFDMENSLAKVLFEKITTSKIAVASFIKDKRLAERILTDASLRKKLWTDKAIRDRLTNEPGAFKSARDFENFIAERVKNYSS